MIQGLQIKKQFEASNQQRNQEMPTRSISDSEILPPLWWAARLHTLHRRTWGDQAVTYFIVSVHVKTSISTLVMLRCFHWCYSVYVYMHVCMRSTSLSACLFVCSFVCLHAWICVFQSAVYVCMFGCVPKLGYFIHLQEWVRFAAKPAILGALSLSGNHHLYVNSQYIKDIRT